MKFQPELVGKVEDADDIDRIAFEHICIGNVDAMVFGNEIIASGKLAFAAREGEEDAVEARHMLCLFLFQRRTENARQITDVLGDEEVVLHEAFDIVLARMGRIAQTLCNFRLNVEGKALFCLQRCKMHMAAHGPEKIFGLVEQAQFGS